MTEEEFSAVVLQEPTPEINWGGGIVDFANKDHQEHQPTSWNEQIRAAFLKMDILQVFRLKRKIRLQLQKKITCLPTSSPVAYIWWKLFLFGQKGCWKRNMCLDAPRIVSGEILFRNDGKFGLCHCDPIHSS